MRDKISLPNITVQEDSIDRVVNLKESWKKGEEKKETEIQLTALKIIWDACWYSKLVFKLYEGFAWFLMYSWQSKICVSNTGVVLTVVVVDGRVGTMDGITGVTWIELVQDRLGVTVVTGRGRNWVDNVEVLLSRSFPDCRTTTAKQYLCKFQTFLHCFLTVLLQSTSVVAFNGLKGLLFAYPYAPSEKNIF